ncbi:MAG TPA: right-handed parallel beta-helix repeat-containing protein [Aeromicrobium sp.]|nr:right-handed parallel beta-helix repeat-containing protein [Aeromicrobium sp.]
MRGSPRSLPSARSQHVTVSTAVIGLLLGLLSALAASPASAHVERPSYWPDPAADCSVSPCAGGKVPVTRSLTSALDDSLPGDTRVVCKSDSMTRIKAAIDKARKSGYNIRPYDHRTFSAEEARVLLWANTKLWGRCKYREIQPAIAASRNNDRVVVMPGLYTEPTARSKPTHDPACDAYKMKADSGDPGALSHDYQLHCPNDANLIAVIGRGPDTAPPPATPREDRHGIPNVGACIRCNVQLEGSGVSADDVLIEAGSASAGNGGPSAVGHAKDVGVFVDRADGFVLRNVTVRHAREHDIYVMETDGYLLDRFKTFYAGGYGVLTFVEDHGVVQNCEAAGNGDSGLYPGSGADSTDNRYTRFYPTYRYSQEFRYCDSHHNTGGFSGTNSHGTRIYANNFYDNALGFTTDVFTAPGHPGFPQHGNVIESNNFFSNNFNPFVAGSDVDPFIAAPVGTGLWLAGGNSNAVRNNRFFNNWRRGTMLFAVPDATVCGPAPVGSDTPVPGCNPLGVSTSFNNQQYGNIMGVSTRGVTLPNGVDFWWDSFPGNTGNCWWGNTAAPGRTVTVSAGLTGLPDCNGGKDPGSSVGTGAVPNELELVACLAGFTVSGYPAGNSTICTWSTTPPKPSGSGTTLPLSSETSSATSSAAAERSATSTSGDAAGQTQEFADICAQGLSPRLCKPYADKVKASAAAPEPKAPDVDPEFTAGPLSSFTCSWWRKADDAHRLGMVQRISRFATGRVDGSKALGFGAGMSDGRAMQLFEDRCSTFQAGPFALYKIYGAAAPFAALTD